MLYDREREDRERIAAALAAERGAVLVPPFDDARIVAGQGTAGLELGQAAAARGVELDALYVPCSGGGLVAGSALAIKSVFPDCAVYAVEPKGYDDLARSLAAGERVAGSGGATTLCDGLMAPTDRRDHVRDQPPRARGRAWPSTTLRCVPRWSLAVRHLKVVLEPSGAAALAAVLASPPQNCRAVGVILSGGNVDPALLATVLAGSRG